MRRTISRRRPPLVLVMLLLAVVVGVTACGSGSASGAALSPSEQQLLLHGRVVVPPCLVGNVIATPPPTEQEGVTLITLASQVQQILGFQPILPSQLPPNVTWNLAYVETAPPADDPAGVGVPGPWLHAAYRVVMPTLQKFSPAPPSVLTLDETTSSHFAPTSLYPQGSALQAGSQSSAHVGSASATLYHYNAPQGSQVVLLVWQSGKVNYRLAAVSGGSYQLAFSAALVTSASSAASDTIASWSGASDQALLSVAQSLQPYTGCTSGK